MTLLDEFVLLIGALAWPLATLAIAFLFRREFRIALGRLGQVKYGAMEMTFRDDLRQAESLAKTVGKAEPARNAAPEARVRLEAASADTAELAGTLVGREPSTATTVVLAAGSKAEPRTPRTLESYQRLCQSSPRVAILEAWDELNQTVLQAAATLGDRRGGSLVRIESASRFLVDRGWLPSAAGPLIERLQRLSQQAERQDGGPLTVDEASRFVDLVVPLVARVASLI